MAGNSHATVDEKCAEFSESAIIRCRVLRRRLKKEFCASGKLDERGLEFIHGVKFVLYNLRLQAKGRGIVMDGNDDWAVLPSLQIVVQVIAYPFDMRLFGKALECGLVHQPRFCSG